MKIVGKTDIGMVRDTNQDAFKIIALGAGSGLALVCDGMGGARGGDTASTIAKKVITETVQQAYRDVMGAEAVKSMIAEAIASANRAIYQTSRDHPELSGMGTTVVLCLLHQQRAYAAHVGDSRLYLMRQNVLTQITKDHSFIQEMVDRGEISSEEARVHPGKNIITRAVGVHWDVDADFYTLDLNPGDRLLLCTDGLTNLCPDERLSSILQNSSIEEAAEAMIRSANQEGGHDNITVVIVEV